jgi:hypothetical protein
VRGWHRPLRWREQCNASEPTDRNTADHRSPAGPGHDFARKRVISREVRVIRDAAGERQVSADAEEQRDCDALAQGPYTADRLRRPGEVISGTLCIRVAADRAQGARCRLSDRPDHDQGAVARCFPAAFRTRGSEFGYHNASLSQISHVRLQATAMPILYPRTKTPNVSWLTFMGNLARASVEEGGVPVPPGRPANRAGTG